MDNLDKLDKLLERHKLPKLNSPISIKETEFALKNLPQRNSRGFPGGAVVENLPANAGDTGSSPGLGRSHMPRSN